MGADNRMCPAGPTCETCNWDLSTAPQERPLPEVDLQADLTTAARVIDELHAEIESLQWSLAFDLMQEAYEAQCEELRKVKAELKTVEADRLACLAALARRVEP